MKKLILTLLLCLCFTSMAYAENPVGVLFESQYTIDVLSKEIKIVTVDNYSWEIIVRHHFGGKHSEPWKVLGFYLAYKYTTKVYLSSYTTYAYWIFIRARYDKTYECKSSQEVREEVLGHEIMHVINNQHKARKETPPYDIDGKDNTLK